MAAANDIFSLYPTATWSVAGNTFRFPVANIKESRRNRLVPHRRPYRDGARLDDTFADPRIWELTVEAYNSADHEPDVDGTDFYPTVLNKLLDSFDEHETGDLILPTRGKRRCRADSYDRIENHGDRDAAAVVLVFMEDNEDDTKASEFNGPTAASVSKKTAEDAAREVEEQGAGGSLAGSMAELGSDLQGLMNAPGDFVGDIEAQAKSIANTADKIEETFAKTTGEATNEAETLLTDPGASRALRLNRKMSDIAKKAVLQKTSLIGKVAVPKIFPIDLSLFAIAASLSVDVVDVLLLNPSLDPFNVPAGTVVQVYE